MASLIAAGRAWARFEHGQVVFKAEVGSQSPAVGQIQGVWVHPERRGQGLGTAGALVAGIGYMFGGKWMLHLLGAGHQTFAPIAWLPLIVLLLEQAIRRAGRGEVVAALLRAAWAGALIAGPIRF